MMKKKRETDRISTNRIYVDASKKLFEVYKPDNGELDTILKVQFGQGLPANIKSQVCECEIFSSELERFLALIYSTRLSRGEIGDRTHDGSTCFACLDYASRANLRVFVNKRNPQISNGGGNVVQEEDSFCYHVKWQSYDSLSTPLVDCFLLADAQWFGLGDIHSPYSWPLNRLKFNWTPLSTNLSSEFQFSAQQLSSDEASSDFQLNLGSYVNFTLLSTRGIFIGNIHTDFKISTELSHDSRSGANRICLKAACTDKCTENWMRLDHLEKFRHVNNVLEYSICSANSLKSIISSKVKERTQTIWDEMKKRLSTIEKSTNIKQNVTITIQSNDSEKKSESSIEKESSPSLVGVDLSSLSSSGASPEPLIAENRSIQLDASAQNESTIIHPLTNSLPDGIGLIERTIFATSLEYLPVLDGQTLRQYVDSVVRLGLKTSSILLIDSRWETYIGSLKLNVALFPKSKLLFEILHNKGFKIVLTVKPYIDAAIGIGKINQLFDSGRLYEANFKTSTGKDVEHVDLAEAKTVREPIVRRTSLFSFQNHSVALVLNGTGRFPFMFSCKESQEGYCALLDLAQASNRAWFISNIKKSNSLVTEANGFQISGAHPIGFNWDDHYRSGVDELVKNLMYKEKLFTISQWTGEFGYIQLAARKRTWSGLKSILNSVLTMGMMGFSLVHPGSVWGDLKVESSSAQSEAKSTNRIDSIYRDSHSSESSELFIRWLQVAVFLPILQFNDIEPIEKYALHELVQTLVKVRKTHIVPELKKNLPFTPLTSQSKSQLSTESPNQMSSFPLIRPVWNNQDKSEALVPEQFTIGADILVAPILALGVRQRDIYLPTGFWHDELRSINIRGGKWLRNYPVELTEVSWFTRAKR